MSVFLPLCMCIHYVHASGLLQRPRGCVRYPGRVVALKMVQPLCGCWDSDLRPLQEKQVLTAVPLLCPTFLFESKGELFGGCRVRIGTEVGLSSKA